MKLNIFNSWKDMGVVAGRVFKRQTFNVGGKNLFTTLIKDVKTDTVIGKAQGITKEKSIEAASRLLKNSGGEAIWAAVENKELLRPSTLHSTPTAPSKTVEWRDGPNHRYRAQKKIVGEQEIK